MRSFPPVPATDSHRCRSMHRHRAVRERDNIAETNSESGIAWVTPSSLESILQDAEKVRQHRSRLIEILNEDPAASPLGGAHKLGAPYSSHRAPPRVRLGPSLAAALSAEGRVSARRGWAGEKSGHFEHPVGVFFCYGRSVSHRGFPCQHSLSVAR